MLNFTPVEMVVTCSTRGMKNLLRALPSDPGSQAAHDLIRETRTIVVGTGFPVNGRPETDGPPGAFALLDALRAIGKTVKLASWTDALGIFARVRSDIEFIEVPIGGNNDRRKIEADALVTIEVCGRCLDGIYRNMNGDDISAQVPRFEDMFGFESLVSVGDGGNEFGMGSDLVSPSFFDDLPFKQPISNAHNLVPASVSNYGAYAVIRELEWATGRGLLPDPSEHGELIHQLVKAGCVDGFSGEAVLEVDGRPLQETLSILRDLKRLSGRRSAE